MSKHRDEPDARHRHRQRVRLRYGRIVMLSVSLGVTLVAVLAGAGVLGVRSPSGASLSGAADRAIDPMSSPLVASGPSQARPSSIPTDSSTPAVTAAASPTATAPSDPEARSPAATADASLPANSGRGRRVVFDQSDQRVWLVDDEGTVVQTYLVSGSMHDNLAPGSYQVYSRSQNAIGIDDSGTMKWMVRFATGKRAPIGFHDIPINKGKPVQTVAQLGTALSHGCIRQKTSDAKALWAFAPLGTQVVVTA